MCIPTLLMSVWMALENGAQSPAALPEERNGLLEVEAESFSGQEKTGKRKWVIQSAPDSSHAGTASGGAYIEVLPDTRRTHDDALIHGENFANQGGTLAVVHYRVRITTVGRYHVWVRAYSTGTEDNGVHVGLDGKWPETGARMQWCEGKNSWRWESSQRTEQKHCGEPGKIWLDIEQAGEHTISFSMREDGFEIDKWLISRDATFRPEH